MTASASRPAPQITLDTRQIRRNRGCACHRSSQDTGAKIRRPSSSGRANRNAAGRPLPPRPGPAVNRNQSPHSPVISPSLASRSRGLCTATERISESATVPSTSSATGSACRRTASCQAAPMAGGTALSARAVRADSPVARSR